MSSTTEQLPDELSDQDNIVSYAVAAYAKHYYPLRHLYLTFNHGLTREMRGEWDSDCDPPQKGTAWRTPDDPVGMVHFDHPINDQPGLVSVKWSPDDSPQGPITCNFTIRIFDSICTDKAKWRMCNEILDDFDRYDCAPFARGIFLTIAILCKRFTEILDRDIDRLELATHEIFGDHDDILQPWLMQNPLVFRRTMRGDRINQTDQLPDSVIDVLSYIEHIFGLAQLTSPGRIKRLLHQIQHSLARRGQRSRIVNYLTRYSGHDVRIIRLHRILDKLTNRGMLNPVIDTRTSVDMLRPQVLYELWVKAKFIKCLIGEMTPQLRDEDCIIVGDKVIGKIESEKIQLSLRIETESLSLCVLLEPLIVDPDNGSKGKPDIMVYAYHKTANTHLLSLIDCKCAMGISPFDEETCVRDRYVDIVASCLRDVLRVVKINGAIATYELPGDAIDDFGPLSQFAAAPGNFFALRTYVDRILNWDGTV